jgi:hypothetical protein
MEIILSKWKGKKTDAGYVAPMYSVYLFFVPLYPVVRRRLGEWASSLTSRQTATTVNDMHIVYWRLMFLRLSAPGNATVTVAGLWFAFGVQIPAAGNSKGDRTFPLPPAAAITGVHLGNAIAASWHGAALPMRVVPTTTGPPARVRSLQAPPPMSGAPTSSIAAGTRAGGREGRRLRR